MSTVPKWQLVLNSTTGDSLKRSFEFSGLLLIALSKLFIILLIVKLLPLMLLFSYYFQLSGM